MRVIGDWKPACLPGIDRTRFRKVGREAPGVVDAVVGLPDDWRAARGP